MLFAAVFVRRRIRAVATSKSSSAQRTHSRVAGFIHHLSLGEHRPREAIPAAHPAGFPDEQIHRKRSFRPSPNRDNLVSWISAKGQDNDQIYVRVWRRGTRCVRTKQDYSLRQKLASQDAAIGLDLFRSHPPSAIPERTWHLRMPKPRGSLLARARRTRFILSRTHTRMSKSAGLTSP